MSAYELELIFKKYTKIIAWGAGQYFEHYNGLIKQKLDYIVDRNIELVGKEKEGIEIVSLRKLKEEIYKENCLIIVFNAKFEEIVLEIKKLGEFDVIDIKTVEAIYKHNYILQEYDFKQTEHKLPVLICAGMHAFWETNGTRKFIDSQIKILHKKGLKTLEVAPLEYYQKGDSSFPFLSISFNRKDIRIISLENFVESYKVVYSMIIHSLYYNHKILEILLKKIIVQGNILYYLHDYYCICNNRFLYYKKISCLDNNKNFHCETCEQNEKRKEINIFHRILFKSNKIKLIAPSEDTAKRVNDIYKNCEVTVIPHLLYNQVKYKKQLKKTIKIAYIGVPYWLKGWKDYEYLFTKLNDKYEFFCLGTKVKDSYTEGITYVEVTLKKESNMVEMLKKYDIDMVYMGALWPETFSYTYYEAYEAGCFILTNEFSGNICDQVRVNRNGIIFQSIDETVLWLNDIEKVRQTIFYMNKKISDVRPNEIFIQYMEKKDDSKNNSNVFTTIS